MGQKLVVGGACLEAAVVGTQWKAEPVLNRLVLVSCCCTMFTSSAVVKYINLEVSKKPKFQLLCPKYCQVTNYITSLILGP